MTGVKKTNHMLPNIPMGETSASQASANTQTNATTAATPAAPVALQGSEPGLWSQFTDAPQTYANTVRGQVPGSNLQTVLRTQLQVHNQGYGGMSPYDTYSWRTTGSPQLDTTIDNMVDKMLFDPTEGLGLPQETLGSRHQLSASAEKSVQGGNLAGAPEASLANMIPAYGMRGQTIGEIGGAALHKQGGFYLPMGDSASLSGYGQVTGLAARARSYGGIDPHQMAAEFGLEANVTLLDARAGFSTQSTMADLGVATVGRQTSVDTRLYAGADAWVDTRVSFDNGPRVRLGAGAFAGASAEIAASDTVTINGRAVAGGHAIAKAWAGAGAKLDIDAGFENGKLNFRFDIGAAWGVGLEFDFGFSIDFKAMAGAIKDVIKGVVGTLAPYAGQNSINGELQQLIIQQIMQEMQRVMSQHAQEMSQTLSA